MHTGFPDTNAVIMHSTTGFEYLTPEYLTFEDYLYKLNAFNLESSNLLAKVILKIWDIAYLLINPRSLYKWTVHNAVVF